MATHKLETTIEIENEDLDITVEFDVLPGEKRTFDSPGHPASIEIVEIIDTEAKEKMPYEGFSKKQIQLIEEEAFEYLDSTEKGEADLADDKNREMENGKMSSEMTFASAGEAIQHLADELGKKVVIAAEEEKEEKAQLKEAMIDKTHRLVLVDEKDGKYKVEVYEITDAGSNLDKEYSFSRSEQAQDKFEELLPKEEEEETKEESEAESSEKSEEENESKEEGEGKMAKDLMFANSDKALQHLANLTGKKIVVAGNKSTFPCPNCGTKVLENTKYCVKCKKKVEKA